MQSLVPRAIAIIKFGAKGDNCAVAKYKTTKVAERLSILAVNSIFFALASLAAVFQCIVLGGRGGGGKCDQDAQKSNFTASCLNTFVAYCRCAIEITLRGCCQTECPKLALVLL